MSLRFLFIDFNSFFASVEQALRPELRGRPVAVVPVMAETTSCIAASKEAKLYGVKTGTPRPKHGNFARASNSWKRVPRPMCIITANSKKWWMPACPSGKSAPSTRCTANSGASGANPARRGGSRATSSGSSHARSARC